MLSVLPFIAACFALCKGYIPGGKSSHNASASEKLTVSGKAVVKLFVKEWSPTLICIHFVHVGVSWYVLWVLRIWGTLQCMLYRVNQSWTLFLGQPKHLI